MAVSYTHLDVYKRQSSGREPPAGAPGNRLSPWGQRRRKNHPVQRAVRPDFAGPGAGIPGRPGDHRQSRAHQLYAAKGPADALPHGLGPVSYTHLDVYKRQAFQPNAFPQFKTRFNLI